MLFMYRFKPLGQRFAVTHHSLSRQDFLPSLLWFVFFVVVVFFFNLNFFPFSISCCKLGEWYRLPENSQDKIAVLDIPCCVQPLCDALWL